MASDFFSFNSNTLVLIGSMALGAATIWQNFRKGRSQVDAQVVQAREELIALQKEQLEAERDRTKTLKEENLEMSRQLNALTLELGELKGRLATFEAVLQGRSPELDKTLNNLNDLAVILPPFIGEVRAALKIKPRPYTASITSKKGPA